MAEISLLLLTSLLYGTVLHPRKYFSNTAYYTIRIIVVVI